MKEQQQQARFRRIVNDPHTASRIIHAVPLGYTVKEMNPVYRVKQIIVEIHPCRVVPEIHLPSDLKPFILFCPWAQSFIQEEL